MERQVTKLRADLETSNRELSETNLQLSQLRKRAYAVLFFRRRDTILVNGFVFRARVYVISFGSDVQGIRSIKTTVRARDGHVAKGDGTRFAGKQLNVN